MQKYGILSCYTTGISEQMKKCDYLDYISLRARVGEREFENGDISLEDYFKLIEETGEVAKTAQPSTQEIENVLSKKLQEYENIFFVCIHRELSGVLQNLTLAINNLEANNRVHIIEAESIVLSESVVIDFLIKQIDGGSTDTEAILTQARTIGESAKTFLFPQSLKYLKHSGRINGLQSVVGAMLNMKVFLEVENGKASVVGKGRGIGSILKYLDHYIDEHKCSHAYFTQYLGSQEIKEQVIKFLQDKGIVLEVVTSEDLVAPTHFGPGTFGVCFYKEVK